MFEQESAEYLEDSEGHNNEDELIPATYEELTGLVKKRNGGTLTEIINRLSDTTKSNPKSTSIVQGTKQLLKQTEAQTARTKTI